MEVQAACWPWCNYCAHNDFHVLVVNCGGEDGIHVCCDGETVVDTRCVGIPDTTPPGPYEKTIDMGYQGWCTTATVVINVQERVDLTIGDVPAVDEDTLGVVVPRNDDDDDNDGGADVDQGGAIPEENDLIPLRVEVMSGSSGVVTLGWTVDTLRVYENDDRSGALSSGVWWPVSDLPKNLHVEGVETVWWGASGIGASLSESPGTCGWLGCEDGVTVTVAKVYALEWETFEDNTALDTFTAPGSSDQGGGGMRVFPGKLNPNDDDNNAQDRRKVVLVATVWPLVPDVTVYFRVWDVDDPFNENNPDLPNVGLVDNDASGPDNRGTDWMPHVYIGETDGYGQARVEVEVSMQPGNNYRAGASLLMDAVTTDQVEQTDADALNVRGGDWSGYEAPLVWSKMLTVWRKLHVEADSMAAEPTTAEDRFPDWQDVHIQSIPAAGTLQLSNPLSGNSDHQFEGGRIVVETGYTLPVIDHTDYAIQVAGLEPPLWTYIAGHYAVIKDDDPDSGLLPHYYSMTGLIENRFADAYIEIVAMGQDENPNRSVDWDLYLSTTETALGIGWNNAQDQWSSGDYWCSLLVAGYQAAGTITPWSPPDLDNDPDPLVDNSTFPFGPFWGAEYSETKKNGVTAGFGDWGSVFFRATIVDFPEGPDLESKVIAHEIGHSAGNTGTEEGHHSEGGLMSQDMGQASGGDYADRWHGETLRRFREAEKW